MYNNAVEKALDFGVRERLVAWLTKFLVDRRQAFRFQGESSAFLPLNCEELQGTKTGPLFFLIFNNDVLKDTGTW